MANAYGAPEISVQDVARMRDVGHTFVLLDVRESMELLKASLGSEVVSLPLSELASARLAALPASVSDKETEIVVFCHTGVRSAQVTAWLLYEGWVNVKSMAGGIDAYAREIDPQVGFY